MSNLRLSFLVDASFALASGCCPGQFYAMIFSPDGQSALKLISTVPDVWQMASFVTAQQTSFAIPLEEDAVVRSFFYTKDIQAAEFTITGDVLPYTIEYWRRASNATAHDRSADTLISKEDLYWNGTDKVASILPDSEVLRIQSVEATAQVAYNSVTATITAIAYLLAGGEIQAATTYAAIQIYDSAGASVGGGSTTTQIANTPGAFKLTLQPVTLSADSVYSMEVTVRLAGVDYKSIVPIVVYD